MEDKLQHILSHQDLVSMAYDYYPSSAKKTQNNAASAMGQQVCLQTDQIKSGNMLHQFQSIQTLVRAHHSKWQI